MSLGWDEPGAFSKEPINFPSFLRLLIGLPPGETDRPLWAITSPVSPGNQIPEAGKGAVSMAEQG